MTSDKKYVLFDWDNTVRKGYTLYSWVDYLCTHSIVEPSLQHELDRMKEQYKKRIISHDQYADIACAKYAAALKGIAVKIINNAILDYITCDRQYLFDSIIRLFDLLNKKGVDIIIISGAPEIILREYKNEFHFKALYAFKEKESCGAFTGDVEYNSGFDKRTIVINIIEKYRSYPYMAFGDSESDIPMLEYAENAFCMNNILLGKKYKNIDPYNIPHEILEKLYQL